ncbi:MAG: VCBS repeat-containing protein [Pyrinomonadaceae bacterium]|nr:VCBS repeat-containing protein [Pyrinomonadaceae bacterium]
MRVLNLSRMLVLALGIGLCPGLALAHHISSSLDGTAPALAAGVDSATTGTMTARLFRDGSTPGTCDTPKAVTSQGNMAGTFRYDTYTITPTSTGCVTISSHYYGGTGNFQVTVYSSFDPTNIKANFIADSNASVTATTREFLSFMAYAGTPYTIVVWNPTSGVEGTPYLFELSDSLARPGDFDGDGYTDTAVFRPSTGDWYVLQSSTNTTVVYQFGVNGDIPIDADYDGDGVTDLAIFRPSAGQWWFKRSSNGVVYGCIFGASGDKPTPGDYDKDGIADIAFFRPGNSNWYVLRSSDNFATYYGYPYGTTGDIPVASERK